VKSQSADALKITICVQFVRDFVRYMERFISLQSNAIDHVNFTNFIPRVKKNLHQLSFHQFSIHDFVGTV
jgi:hypothetical protein